MFYFGSNDLEIAGASPETLVKLTDGHLYTFPLAGTRPRGKNREEDEKLEKELLSDEKELAEHNMLVDLGRNDIGRVADLVEIGIPFSDPIAEGKVIQAANVRALQGGINLPKIFELVKSVRKKTDIPLVFLTYLNVVFNCGYDNFFKTCQDTGVDGIIIRICLMKKNPK